MSPSYGHGRKSFARCCCLFYKSPFDLCLFSLDLHNFSHVHHMEENQDSVNLATEVLSPPSQYLSLHMCSYLWTSIMLSEMDWLVFPHSELSQHSPEQQIFIQTGIKATAYIGNFLFHENNKCINTKSREIKEN